jgi:hypothetical protein
LKKDRVDSCSVIVGIALLSAGAYIAYQIAVFFSRPDALVRIVNFIEAIGLCIGAAIALLVVVYLFDSASSSARNRFRRQSKVFLGQACAKLMLPLEHDPIPEDLPEAPNQASSSPISVNLAMTNYGLWVTTDNPRKKETASNSPSEGNIPENFLGEFNNSIIIPVSNISLYYLASHRNSSLEFEVGPGESPGFTGRIPKLAEGDLLRIVIVFNCILERDSLREVVRLKQPVKMQLIVQDRHGNDDVAATSSLYDLIYDKKQEIEAQDDDSWMYRSRPMYW